MFTESYDYVGKLLKPGEAPTNYSDEEDEGSQQETEAKPKDDWPIDDFSVFVARETTASSSSDTRTRLTRIFMKLSEITIKIVGI